MSNIVAYMNFNKRLIGKKIFSKVFGPFLTHSLRNQPLLLGIERYVLTFQTIFVQQAFRSLLPMMSYSEKYILG